MQEKLLTKFNTIIENLQELGIQDTYLNIIKAIYDKPRLTSYSMLKS